jgi:hypothetical protein
MEAAGRHVEHIFLCSKSQPGGRGIPGQDRVLLLLEPTPD